MEFLEPTNRLQDVLVQIDGYIMPDISIISCEIGYSVFSPKLQIAIILEDLIGIGSTIDPNGSDVVIIYRDIFDKQVTTFGKVTAVSITSDGPIKYVMIAAQDEFTWTLERSFNSHTFNGDITQAITAYMQALGIAEYPITIDDTSDEGEAEPINFTIQKGKNNLEAFMIEIENAGYLFFHNKDGINILSYDAIKTKNLLLNNPESIMYTDKVMNTQYINHIISYKPKIGASSVPTNIRSFAFDPMTKTTKYMNINIFDDVKLNPGSSDSFQGVAKPQDVKQTTLNFNQTKMKMRNDAFKSNMVDIIVKGKSSNDIHQVYNIKIFGDIATAEEINDGNTKISGYFLALTVSDKIISGHLIQKITLGRAETI